MQYEVLGELSATLTLGLLQDCPLTAHNQTQAFIRLQVATCRFLACAREFALVAVGRIKRAIEIESFSPSSLDMHFSTKV